MPNREHLEILSRGVEAWNKWRREHPDIRPALSDAKLRGGLRMADLSGANLSGANLSEAVGADLSKADLRMADLLGADLRMVDLRETTLSQADLRQADLRQVNLRGANLSEADLHEANLRQARLREATLSEAELRMADLSNADLIGADLQKADLYRASLLWADLSGADLSRAYLYGTSLVEAKLKGANLCESHVYGVSVWNVATDKTTKQTALVITRRFEAKIVVDDLKLAQFLYLLLDNEEVRNVIDTITSKVVLILGRFSEERKAVLDALREELRERWGYVPVLFDFEQPASKTVTGTVATLARMARFIIADLTDPSSVPHELATTVPGLTKTAVHPIRLKGSTGYGMFGDLMAYPWVLEPYEYDGPVALIGSLGEVLTAAEERVVELRGE